MQTISKNQIKHIRSLSQLKFRKEHRSYIVEGIKNASEWLQQKADIDWIVGTEDWLQSNLELIKHYDSTKCLLATDIDFEKISGFKTPNQVLLVVKMPDAIAIDKIEKGAWTLVLDKVQDPGNMGTIIRTADWFGIKNIICSIDCVEQYNPKVIQSTMGSLLRVNCSYVDLIPFLENNQETPSYAAVLGGSALDANLKHEPGFIIMGNESKGISDAVQALVRHKITIPKIGHAESLNVSVAAGIFCFALIGT